MAWLPPISQRASSRECFGFSSPSLNPLPRLFPFPKFGAEKGQRLCLTPAPARHPRAASACRGPAADLGCSPTPSSPRRLEPIEPSGAVTLFSGKLFSTSHVTTPSEKDSGGPATSWRQAHPPSRHPEDNVDRILERHVPRTFLRRGGHVKRLSLWEAPSCLGTAGASGRGRGREDKEMASKAAARSHTGRSQQQKRKSRNGGFSHPASRVGSALTRSVPAAPLGSRCRYQPRYSHRETEAAVVLPGAKPHLPCS